MKPKGNSLRYWGLLLGTILPLCFQGGAATTENPSQTTQSPSAPPTQTPTSPSPEPTAATTVPTTAMISPETATSASTTLPAPPEPTTQTQGPTPPPPASTLPPGTSPSPSTLATTPAAGKPVSPSEGQTDAQLCEDSKKQLLLICLVVIGVLVLFGLCLLLAVVALVSKLAYIKRRQASQRLPRSNGDFLSTNSLWPAGLETLQRLAAETPGRDAVSMQRAGPGLSGKAAEEASKKLACEISGRQQQQEASADLQRSIVTTVEI